MNGRAGQPSIEHVVQRRARRGRLQVPEGSNRHLAVVGQALHVRERVHATQALLVVKPHQNLHLTHLPRLETRGGPESVSKRQEVLWRQGFHHLPLVGEQTENFTDALEVMNHAWDGGFLDGVLVHERAGFFEFAKDEFEPQLKGLVHDDEVKLVVAWSRIVALRPVLKGKQFLEAQIASVRDASRRGSLVHADDETKQPHESFTRSSP